MSLNKTPFFELRSGSVDALQFVVKTTDLDALKSELTRRFEATPEFFSGEVVTIDVRRLGENERASIADIAQLLDAVRMRPIGVVAAQAQCEWAADGGLPLVEARDRRAGAGGKTEAVQPGVDTPHEQPAGAGSNGAAAAVAPAPAQTLVIDKPLRSGQQAYAKGGDLIVHAAVNAGAEVLADGNVHVYGPLCGKAIAGSRGNTEARIFTTCLEPELIAIAGVYRTMETPLPKEVAGKPAQVRLVDGVLVMTPLKL